MRFIQILFLALLLPIPAQAKTAAELQDDCAAFHQQPNTGENQTDLARMSTCVAYIYGVLDVPNMYEVVDADYCAPASTTRGTLLGTVREYIQRPEVAKMNWPGSGPQVIINALQAKWPCKTTDK